MLLTTDKAVDVLVEITPYIADIVNDKDIQKLIEKNKKKPPASQVAYMAELIPTFLKRHRKAIYVILGAVYSKTPEEIAAQSFTETVKQIREIAEDKELVGFFSSLAKQE